MKPYVKKKHAEAKAEIREYEEQILRLESDRLKNADPKKREQLETKRNRIKEIKEDLIPVLEKRIEDLRAEELEHVNHKEDLFRKIQDLDHQIRKFGFEMKKARGDYEHLKKRQDKAQVGSQLISFGLSLLLVSEAPTRSSQLKTFFSQHLALSFQMSDDKSLMQIEQGNGMELFLLAQLVII